MVSNGETGAGEARNEEAEADETGNEEAEAVKVTGYEDV